jgi:hypothetical protein
MDPESERQKHLRRCLIELEKADSEEAINVLTTRVQDASCDLSWPYETLPMGVSCLVSLAIASNPEKRRWILSVLEIMTCGAAVEYPPQEAQWLGEARDTLAQALFLWTFVMESSDDRAEVKDSMYIATYAALRRPEWRSRVRFYIERCPLRFPDLAPEVAETLECE